MGYTVGISHQTHMADKYLSEPMPKEKRFPAEYAFVLPGQHSMTPVLLVSTKLLSPFVDLRQDLQVVRSNVLDD